MRVPSLRHVLRVLRRAGVDPADIFVSDDVFRDIDRQVKEILAEDDEEDDLPLDRDLMDY